MDKPQTPPFVRIPRPFNSPRLPPRKRPLAPEIDSLDHLPCQKVPTSNERSEGPPAKQPKLELERNMQILDQISPETPEIKAARAVECTPQKLPSLRGPRPNRKLEDAIKVAMGIFIEVLTEYQLEKDVRGEDKADILAEKWASEHYEELKNAIVGLLPWAGEMKAAAKGKYDVIQFRGRKTPRWDDVTRRQLQHFRAEGAQARAWEALCAVMAAISSRKEKVWLENNELSVDLKKMFKKMPLCKTKRSARRRAAIREAIPKLLEEGGAGAFSPYLIDPRSVHRLTFAPGPEGPVPATHTTIRRMPLFDAFQTMDDEGPLRGAAAEKGWCCAAGSEFALQNLEYGHKNGSRKERLFARKLQPDKELRDLLKSKKPVVVLDTLAALAPKEVCRNQGFSKIVTAELEMIFRQAKEEGVAVVFSLGSEFPHKLAEKVYLRSPLADYGMRCGCLRWRESSDVPWAREFRWDDRITLCLQMP